MEMHPDVRLALAAIAGELRLELDALPDGVIGVLTAFRSAAYGDGCREALRRLGRDVVLEAETPLVRSED